MLKFCNTNAVCSCVYSSRQGADAEVDVAFKTELSASGGALGHA